MKKKVRILSLDGGGIRGVIPATVIQYVEEYLQKKAPGTTIADHFDLIAGTSTGGILACIYLTPEKGNRNKAKFNATEALDFYVKEGYGIFNGSKMGNLRRLWGLRNATQFSPKRIEQLFKSKFGDILISDLRKSCLITTYNMDQKTAFFFTNKEDIQYRNFFVHDVTRSTSAAPTYFPPAKIKNMAPNAGIGGQPKNMINLDGGVFANNPMMCAYAEARNSNFTDRNNNQPSAKEMYVLSIGTGGGGFQLKNKRNSGNWNLLNWASAIPNIMMDGSVDTVAFQMKEIFETVESEEDNYLRIDVPENARKIYASDMSDASDQNIQNLLTAGKKTVDFAKANQKLDAFLDGLLD